MYYIGERLLVISRILYAIYRKLGGELQFYDFEKSGWSEIMKYYDNEDKME